MSASTSISYQWDNGAWTLATGIPLTDRGFRHGMSVFETIAIHRGRFVLLNEHLEKLRLTSAQLGFREPPNTADFKLELPQTGIARLYITAGDGGFRASLDQGRTFLTVATTPSSSEVQGGVPASLSISSTPHQPVWPGRKTGNYWPNIQAHRQACDYQADELVLISLANHVISASLANLFAVINGEILTPRTASGARAGVMRDWVLAKEEVIVTDFHPEQLREASEIFLTSSGYGIAPITCLEGKPLPKTQLGFKLRAEYLTWLEES